MITGFNTDITYNQRVYHVQTEDVGGPDPYALTLLYHKGAIIARIKTNYLSLSPQKLTEHQTLELMRRQHQRMISDLRSGKFSAETGVEPPREFAEDLTASEKTFDQVILDYLAGQDPPPDLKK